MNTKMQEIRKVKLIMLFAIIAALCLFASVRKTFSQTTAPSTQAQETDEQRRIKILEALERAQDEVKASRAYIKGLEKQVTSKQSIIDAQTKRQILSDEAISSLQKETEIAKAAITSEEKTIELQKLEVDYLKKELDKTNKKLKRSRNLNRYLIVGIGALIFTTIFK